MSSERSLVDGDYDWSPLFHPVDLSLVRITLPASLLSMAAQEVMKNNAIVEDTAPNLSTNDNLQCRLALIALVNKHVPFRYAEDLFRFWEKPVISLKRIYMIYIYMMILVNVKKMRRSRRSYQPQCW